MYIGDKQKLFYLVAGWIMQYKILILTQVLVKKNFI